MDMEAIIALIIAVPVILFPAAFVWHLNIGGVIDALKRAKEKRARENRPEAIEAVEIK